MMREAKSINFLSAKNMKKGLILNEIKHLTYREKQILLHRRGIIESPSHRFINPNGISIVYEPNRVIFHENIG
jgi:hypothetical protein